MAAKLKDRGFQRIRPLKGGFDAWVSAGFEVEHWSVEEDDRPTALGEPHHFHLVEFVARRLG